MIIFKTLYTKNIPDGQHISLSHVYDVRKDFFLYYYRERIPPSIGIYWLIYKIGSNPETRVFFLYSNKVNLMLMVLITILRLLKWSPFHVSDNSNRHLLHFHITV